MDLPDGHQVELTDERVEGVPEIGRRFFRWRAERLRRDHRPLIPSYHTRVEKIGFLRWAVVPYQNRIVKTDAGEPIGGSKTARAFRPGDAPEA